MKYICAALIAFVVSAEFVFEVFRKKINYKELVLRGAMIYAVGYIFSLVP